MTWMIGDFGNSDVKAGATLNGRWREVVFPHAFAELNEGRWDEIALRAQRTNDPISPDYLRVNGIPVAIGEKAFSHAPHFEPAQHVERYRFEYMQFLTGAAMARLFETGRTVQIMALHPPAALRYLDALMTALGGYYRVEIGGEQRDYFVDYVRTNDEAHAVFCRRYLTDDGLHLRTPSLEKGRTLVVDPGGGTTDFMRVERTGEVDPAIATSINVGINQIMRELEEGLKAAYPHELRNAGQLNRADLAEALQTGVFPAAGQDLQCDYLVEQATNLLISRFRPAYHNIAGGPTEYRTIILGGGGGAMLAPHLTSVLEHHNVLMAEDHPAEMRFAAIRGQESYRKLLEDRGAL